MHILSNDFLGIDRLLVFHTREMTLVGTLISLFIVIQQSSIIRKNQALLPLSNYERTAA